VQVVVLAGGFGTRLRPWTKHVVKPLLPLLDKTLIERVIETLPEEVVDEVLIAAGYGIDQMREHFSGIDTPYPVRIVEEFEPLGTGGAIANCREYLTGTFAVMNGDLLSSVNFTQMLAVHGTQRRALATISLWEVDDPTRFGVCDYREGLIYQFQEKPTLEEACSNMINAGCYILDMDIFERMPDGPHSLERDVFTYLAAESLLRGCPFEGHFVDAGTPESWLEAMHICLTKQRWQSGAPNGSGSWIGPSANVDGGALDSSIGEAAEVKEGALVTRSSVLRGACIEADAAVQDCLIGEWATIGEGAHIEGVVVDYRATVPAGHVQTGGTFEADE